MGNLFLRKCEDFIRKQIDANKGEFRRFKYRNRTYNFANIQFDYDLIVDVVDKHIIIVFALNTFKVSDNVDTTVSKAFGEEPTQFPYRVITTLINQTVNKKILPALYRYFGITSASVTLFREDRKQVGRTQRFIFQNNKFESDNNFPLYEQTDVDFKKIEIIQKKFEGKSFNMDNLVDSGPVTATIHHIIYMLYSDGNGDCVVHYRLSGPGASHLHRIFDEEANSDNRWTTKGLIKDIVYSSLMVNLKDFQSYARAMNLPYNPKIKWSFDLGGGLIIAENMEEKVLAHFDKTLKKQTFNYQDGLVNLDMKVVDVHPERLIDGSLYGVDVKLELSGDMKYTMFDGEEAEPISVEDYREFIRGFEGEQREYEKKRFNKIVASIINHAELESRVQRIAERYSLNLYSVYFNWDDA